MDAEEKQSTIDRYNRRLAEYGVSEKALGWGDKGRSKLRFEILLSAWDFKDSSVLDFGCGFGALFEYMRKKRIKNFKYLGIDINPKLILLAIEKYPEAKFKVHDLLVNRLDPFDYVLSSGVFNHQLKNNWRFIQKTFERFNETARKGFAVNFLSDKVQYRLAETYHADPAKVLELAYKYSNDVVLRNDYMPYEFTIFVNKSSHIDEKLTVFTEYARYV